jgi:hypothetical protein
MVTNTDNNLVLLYRYDTIDTDAQLLNQSESPVYTGLNTSSISGAGYTGVLGPSGATVGSGVLIDSIGTIFHLPPPNQSGNASGVTVETTSAFTFGGWFQVNNNWTNQRAMFANFAFGDAMRRYMVEASSGTPYQWRIRTGQTNGTSTVTVTADGAITGGEWMHVVGQIDGTTSTNNIRIYVSGVLNGSGSAVFDPGNGSSGNHPALRVGGGNSATSETIVNGIGDSSGLFAETFFMDRLLTDAEILDVYQNGFLDGGVSDSDTLDSLKDNTGPVVTSTADIIVTAWDSEDTANPSGFRHALSGIHPAFSGLMTSGSTILDTVRIPDVNIEEVSDTVALTLHSRTDSSVLNNVRFWMSDWSGFSGLNGFQATRHINPLWLPSLALPSGSGVVASSLAGADTVLRSDGGTSISGQEGRNVNDPLNEGDISEYIYLAFDSNSNFSKGQFGPSGFKLRFTTDVSGVA